eukprot:CAMPEP_0167802836 /NCGR_PEP_ID=MMETSP0111_2-20121227/19385_1 /TAXON_ID=91324 /ORGANISM="Lotharella globosa, Strain CCCM811" /LENGTH=290 /DNA_ID=CAMNT_0007699005 /DNA_START=192 /DNA_END=1062 /DNA_ORIENTATION=-
MGSKPVGLPAKQYPSGGCREGPRELERLADVRYNDSILVALCRDPTCAEGQDQVTKGALARAKLRLFDEKGRLKQGSKVCELALEKKNRHPDRHAGRGGGGGDEKEKGSSSSRGGGVSHAAGGNSLVDLEEQVRRYRFGLSPVGSISDHHHHHYRRQNHQDRKSSSSSSPGRGYQQQQLISTSSVWMTRLAKRRALEMKKNQDHQNAQPRPYPPRALSMYVELPAWNLPILFAENKRHQHTYNEDLRSAAAAGADDEEDADEELEHDSQGLLSYEGGTWVVDPVVEGGGE